VARHLFTHNTSAQHEMPNAANVEKLDTFNLCADLFKVYLRPKPIMISFFQQLITYVCSYKVLDCQYTGEQYTNQLQDRYRCRYHSNEFWKFADVTLYLVRKVLHGPAKYPLKVPGQFIGTLLYKQHEILGLLKD